MERQEVAVASAPKSSRKPLPPKFTSHLFLTHSWGKDNRTHEQVRVIKQWLEEHGWSCWFDQDMMTGSVLHQMQKGIEESMLTMVFVTHDYIEKCNSLDNNSCKLEFNYAAAIRSEKKMLLVLLEENLPSQKFWGSMFFQLGAEQLYVDMSPQNIAGNFPELQRQILLRLQEYFPLEYPMNSSAQPQQPEQKQHEGAIDYINRSNRSSNQSDKINHFRFQADEGIDLDDDTKQHYGGLYRSGIAASSEFFFHNNVVLNGRSETHFGPAFTTSASTSNGNASNSNASNSNESSSNRNGKSENNLHTDNSQTGSHSYIFKNKIVATGSSVSHFGPKFV